MTNRWQATVFPTLSKVLMGVLILCAPIVFWGAIKAFSVFSNDVRQWLPSGFQEARDYDWFTQYFGVDEMVVVSWDGCTLDDPRLAEFAGDLRGQRNGNGQLFFDRVVTGPEMLGRMLDGGVSESAAIQRATGVFVGTDGETTCCLAYPSADMVRDRAAVVNLILERGAAVTGLAASEIHLGGPTVDGAAIDQESRNALRNFLWMTFVVVMLLTWFRTRKLTLSILILFFAIYCAALGLALLRWTGGTMNLTMIMLPTLTFILAVSGAVHMTNYFLKAYRVSPATATQDAFRHGGFPVVMSSLTTAVGMGSLASSQILPIRSFGIYSASSVLISLPVLLFLLPIALGMVSRRFPRVFQNVSDEVGGYQTESPVVRRLSEGILRWHLPITIGSILLLAGLGFGVSRLKATVNVQNRFAPSTKIIQDYAWLERELGPLVPMEVILRIPREYTLSNWDRLHLTSLLEKKIRSSDYVNASYSAATFQPVLSRGAGVKTRLSNQALIEGWNRNFPELVRSRLIFEERDEQLWRVSVRINAMKGADYGDLLDSIETVVDGFLADVNQQFDEDGTGSVSAILTGGVPMMYKAQHQVLYDLMVSFLTAFLLISVVMVIVLKGVLAGLVAMLPNIFPPMIVFGAMGWLGWPIEIGSVMTASVALGIAVDDTIHFLAWFRRGSEQGYSQAEAIRYAYRNCAKSMVDTTMICGLGVSPFMFSVFMPTVRFARLMLILLLVGLVGDLAMLPAILFGPLGKLFRRRIASKREAFRAEIPSTVPNRV